MTPLRRVRPALVLAAVSMLSVPAAEVRGQTMGDPEEFSAFAINMGTYVAGTTANLIITVNRWSTDAEKEKLLTTLREKGSEALLDALRDLNRVGTLRTPETVGIELRFAIQEPGQEGGRRVLIITDRPVGFLEARNRPPSVDYQFTVIDMQMKPDGTGQGTMSLAAKVIPAGKNIVVENYDTQPIRLNQIRSRKLTKR